MKRILLLLLACSALYGQSSGVGSIWSVVTGNLQSAAVANGNGTALSVQGVSSAAVTVNCSVTCSGGTTINFEVSQDGTNYVAVTGQQVGTTTIAATVANQSTTPTIWEINVAGMQLLRGRISGYSAGTVTVTASVIAASQAPNVVNVLQSGSWSVTANAGTNLNTSALALESGGNLATLAGGAVTSAVVQANTKQVNGVTTLTGAGATGTGAQRVTVAEDTNTIAGSGVGTAGSASANVVTVQGVASMTKLLVTPDSVALPANQSVNTAQVNGVTTLTGAGASGTGAQRETVSQDTTTIAGSAPGTAGSASANVLTVQGVASMTKLLVTPDSVALPANQSVNTAQVNGVTTLTGAGATGTGSQRTTVAQDTTTVAGSAPGTAGSASANVFSVQGVSSMTPVQVSQATASSLNTTAVGGTVSGTLQSAAVANGNGTPLALSGESTALVTVNCSVACTGGTTINFEASGDAVNYSAVTAMNLGTATLAQTVVNQGTTITVWELSVSGAVDLRARISAYSAGTIMVTAVASAAAPDPKALNANLFLGGTAVSLGTQAAASSVPVALPTATITTLTQPTLQSGSTTAVTQGTAANLKAQVTGAGTAGSADAGVVTVQGVASMTKLLVTPDSVALPANQSVNVAQLAGTTTDTNSGNKSAGTLRVVLATDQPQLTNKLLVTPDANSAVNLAQVAGSTTSTSATGVQKVGIVGNAGATVDQAPGSAVPTNALQIAGTDGTNSQVPYYDACQTKSWTYYPVNVSANTQIVAASASTYYYICEALFPPQAGAVNVQLIEGTGSVCASNTAGLMGGTTAALGANISANGGFIVPFAGRAIASTATANHELCIFASAAVNGVIAYVSSTVAP